MSEDVRRISQEEASAIRRLLFSGKEDVEALGILNSGGRIWAPIEYVREASGKARCRVCGRIIPKGANAVAFGLDFSEGRGRLARAYLHFRPCEPEEEL